MVRRDIGGCCFFGMNTMKLLLKNEYYRFVDNSKKRSRYTKNIQLPFLDLRFISALLIVPKFSISKSFSICRIMMGGTKSKKDK